MKSIIAVLFALAISCEALYPPAGVPAHLYQPVQEVVASAQPIQYSYGYSIPSVVARAPEIKQVSAGAVTIQQQPPVVAVEQVQPLPPAANGIYNPFITPFPGYVPPANFYNFPALPADLAYSYSALPGAAPSIVYSGSSEFVNGIPVNGLPPFAPIATPQVYPIVEQYVPPVLRLLNSSYSYSTPYASVQIANFGTPELVLENQPTVVEIKQEEIKPVEVVHPAITETIEVLPQKPAVVSYEYVIPQEVKPVVPHTVYGVPSL